MRHALRYVGGGDYEALQKKRLMSRGGTLVEKSNIAAENSSGGETEEGGAREKKGMEKIEKERGKKNDFPLRQSRHEGPRRTPAIAAYEKLYMKKHIGPIRQRQVQLNKKRVPKASNFPPDGEGRGGQPLLKRRDEPSPICGRGTSSYLLEKRRGGGLKESACKKLQRRS